MKTLSKNQLKSTKGGLIPTPSGMTNPLDIEVVNSRSCPIDPEEFHDNVSNIGPIDPPFRSR